ncbi:coagulation factor XI-like [Boleophthalmus pectinirostris]|uniref:coagulation factor XI-like n=1 Tax=Boleophthalmus pectinirostris TaxID=150288 RepID=UPI00242BBA58|nr:coagulation factor XI-like [Boleophthalmus pectinirostris]
MCSQEPECFVFAFHGPSASTRKYFCYMWKSGTLKIKNSTGITSGYNLRGCQFKKPCFDEVYEGLKFSNRPYETVQTENPDQCREKCRQDQHCSFYTYYNEGSKCELKFTMPIPTPTFQRMDEVFSGFSNNLDEDFGSGEVCPSQLYRDKQLEGGRYPIKFSAISAQHCQALCNIYPECQVFKYYRNYVKGPNCYMKSETRLISEVITEHQGVTSGRVQKGCKVDFSWKNDVVNGSLSGSAFNVTVKADLECKKACNDEPNCLFYLYVSMNHPAVKHRGKCYLKRDLTLPRPNVFPRPGTVSGFVMNC